MFTPAMGAMTPLGMQAEMQQLLKHRNKQIWTPLQVVTAVIVPSAVFAHCASILAFRTREKYPFLAVLFGPVLGLVVCVVLTRLAMRRLRWELPARGSLAVAVASWAALIVGTYAGDVNYQWYVRSYYIYNDLAAYTNIDPNDDRGQSYMDSGEVYFKESSYVLKSKAIAFENGRIYCVAPIVRKPLEASTSTASGICPQTCLKPMCNAGSSANGGVPLAPGGMCTKRCSKAIQGIRYCGSGATYEDGDSFDCSGCGTATDQAHDPTAPSGGSVDFWAVGVDCCKPSGADFKCGPVSGAHTYARAGLRMIRDDIRPFYVMAVQEWAAARSGILVTHPLFFHWVEDPVAIIDGYYERALRTYGYAVSMFILGDGLFVFSFLWTLYAMGFP